MKLPTSIFKDFKTSHLSSSSFYIKLPDKPIFGHLMPSSHSLKNTQLNSKAKKPNSRTKLSNSLAKMTSKDHH